MTHRETSLPGLLELQPIVARDSRGTFVKTFHQDRYRELGLVTDFAEEYYSSSRRGVVRGMHFQIPPHEHAKVVYCIVGQVMDVIVDLRVGSPTYGQFATFDLNDQKANMLYIPPGMAHGFYALSEMAMMFYHVSTVYSKEHDTGIRWDSLNIPWPSAEPIVSDRDRQFPAFADFRSPFVYSSGAAYAR